MQRFVCKIQSLLLLLSKGKFSGNVFNSWQLFRCFLKVAQSCITWSKVAQSCLKVSRAFPTTSRLWPSCTIKDGGNFLARECSIFLLLQTCLTLYQFILLSLLFRSTMSALCLYRGRWESRRILLHYFATLYKM
jgi:hypothetical protein